MRYLSAILSHGFLSAPFPMELGERQALSTPIATKERFDAALASLKELSQVQYIAPQAPPILAVPDEADIVVVDDQSTQIPDVVNVASNNNPDPAQTNTYPPLPRSLAPPDVVCVNCPRQSHEP